MSTLNFCMFCSWEQNKVCPYLYNASWDCAQPPTYASGLPTAIILPETFCACHTHSCTSVEIRYDPQTFGDVTPQAWSHHCSFCSWKRGLDYSFSASVSAKRRFCYMLVPRV